MIIAGFENATRPGPVSKDKKTEDEDDESYDDIDEIDEEYEDIESRISVTANLDARRRLEQVLEDRALERLIKGDAYYDY